MIGSPLWWRETQRQPKMMFFDGRVVILMVLAIMHIRIWTIALVVVAIAILTLMERKGVGADDIIRYTRSMIVGWRRTARGPAAERSSVDYGFEDRAYLAILEPAVEARIKAMKEIQSKGVVQKKAPFWQFWKRGE